MSVTVETKYQALPFTPTPERAAVVHQIARGIASHENVFTDYQRAHRPLCDDALGCELCVHRIMKVHYLLLDPQTKAWEVWDFENGKVVGLIYLTDLVPGCDALAHYFFFDGDLVGKTGLLKEMIDWCFANHGRYR